MVRLRATPEDFRVDELPLYSPSGEGEHTFLRVEKRLRTTEDVARSLARLAGAKPRDVGYAGRKDRNGVTTQWFSVPGLDPSRACEVELPGIRVLEAVPHPHKLRTGQLAGNRFRIVVREVDDRECAEAADRLEELASKGLPNRFGAQRFGRDGDNVERAQSLLRGEKVAGDRRAARFLLSALQSAVFNATLAAREAPLDSVEWGEVAMVHESGGSFVVEDVERERPRAAAFEISATGPIFGTRLLQPVGAAAERERAALATYGIDPDQLRLPRGIRLRGARRPFRVRPADATAHREAGALVLCFTLPPGSYATVLVEELLPSDAATDGPNG